MRMVLALMVLVGCDSGRGPMRGGHRGAHGAISRLVTGRIEHRRRELEADGALDAWNEVMGPAGHKQQFRTAVDELVRQRRRLEVRCGGAM